MKTNQFFMLFLCVFLLLTGIIYSQTTYYYAFNEKIFLNEAKDKMVVTFQKNNAPAAKELFNSIETEWLNDSICIVNSKSTPNEIFTKKLLQTNGIKSARPVYVTNDGMEMVTTDEIIMRFNKDVSQHK